MRIILPGIYILTVRRMDGTKHDICIDATYFKSFIHICYETNVVNLSIDSLLERAGKGGNCHGLEDSIRIVVSSTKLLKHCLYNY